VRGGAGRPAVGGPARGVRALCGAGRPALPPLPKIDLSEPVNRTKKNQFT